MESARPKIAIVLQGPVQRHVNGYSTFGLLEQLNASPLRGRFHVVSVAWDDDTPENVEGLRARADEVVLATKPAVRGAGNRNLQRTAVATALEALEGRGFAYVLKSRHDFLLSERILGELVARADRGFTRVFVTNLYTKWETFHVSDMFLFSTLENVRAWFDPREVYYQDLFSAEVQFARVFVRNRQLRYPFTQEGYLRFLRDWVEMIDWAESGIVWFRAPTLTRASANRGARITWDHDTGPYMNRLLPGDFPDRLRRQRRSGGLRLRAMTHLVADALWSWGVVEASNVAHLLRLRARQRTVPLPGGRALEVKYGLNPKRYEHYTVDPVGGEETKPVGSEIAPARRSEATAALPAPEVGPAPGAPPAAAAAAPEPPPVRWSRWIGLPFLAVSLRRPKRAARSA